MESIRTLFTTTLKLELSKGPSISHFKSNYKVKCSFEDESASTLSRASKTFSAALIVATLANCNPAFGSMDNSKLPNSISLTQSSTLPTADLFPSEGLPRSMLSTTISSATAQCSVPDAPSSLDSPSGPEPQIEVTNELIVREAWDVVNEVFLDARRRGWSQDQWKVQSTVLCPLSFAQ